MIFISYLHFFCAIVYLYLALIVLTKNPRALINRVCFAILLCFGTWSLSETIIQNPHVTKKTAVLVEHFGAIGWTHFSAFFLWFSLIFTGKKRLSRSFVFIGLLFSLPLILLYKQWTNHITVDHIRHAYGWVGLWADSIWTYLFYSYYFSFAVIGLFLVYDFKRKTTVEINKRQATILLISAIPPLLLGTVSNVLFRQYNITSIPPLADVFILTWAIGMAYAISRYRFLSITPTVAADKIIANMADLLLLLDTNGTIVSVNKAATVILGYEHEELQNNTLEMILSKGERGKDVLLKIHKNEKVNNSEVLLRTKKGTTKPVSLTTSIIPGSGTVCIVHDITLHKEVEDSLQKDRVRLEIKVEERTKELQEANEDLTKEIVERKKAEDELRESEEKLKFLFEFAPDAIYINDFSGTFIDGNKKAEEMTGYKRENLIGKSFLKLKLLPAMQIPKAAKLLAKNVLGYPTGPDEFILNRKDGTKAFVEISSHPIKIKNKKVVLGIARDISKRKHVEEEKIKLEEQLFQAQKMEAIGQLAGGIAHDFNNMLGAISGYADMIKRKFSDGNPKLEKYVNRILDAALRSADLTNKLLTFARKGKHQVAIINIHDAIQGVINLFEHTIDKRITISTALNAKPPMVVGDNTQIQNAILNIAVNALDAMPEGGGLTFATSIEKLDDLFVASRPYKINPGTYLKLSISDTGVGMDEVTQNHIFEPFFTTKDPGKGTGLGLASVYGTVKSHEGFIEVGSKINQGSTFTIYLPITDKSKSDTTFVQDELIRSKEKRTILFIDDEELIRDISHEMLSELGYSVILCKNGEEAVTSYKKRYQEIDLVFLDLIMPKLNGYECFLKLKAINPKLKVIVCSGYAKNEEAQQIIDTGAVGFLQKPFTIENLSKLINEVLHNR